MSDLPGTAFQLDVQPQLPERLQRLEALAGNLWYSWDRPTRMLFKRLHPQLWDAVSGNPRAVLKRVDQARLDQAAEDPGFMAAYSRSLSAFESYRDESLRRAASEWLRRTDLVAYFCAEFGFHESMPIYSGGLGILAGDHCKAASDLRLPFVAVGLLYRQGYFTQTIDPDGNQHPVHRDTDFDDLPIEALRDAQGGDVIVRVALPGREVAIKVWQAHVGHVTLYLLDTDLDANSAADRGITHRLYGGDRTMRIEQEIVLGIGGVRALAVLGVQPTVFHINEGHAAFLVLERARALVAQGLTFDAALEAVAGNTVFTTHTPVPAGHDHFSHEMITAYFEPWFEALGIGRERFVALGRVSGGETEFNMTALAVKGARLVNGVSRIHGGVSSEILRGIWPDVPSAENPVGYVTNGVHVPTFLAQEWGDIFDRYLGFDWERHLADKAFWERVETIPDHLFWSVRQSLKARMLFYVRERVGRMQARNGGSDAQLDRLLRFADPQQPQVLTIGFARRFATYKRATLLFHDIERLKRIVGQADRPVLFVFAGKAHPADVPGQDLIRRIAQIARDPFFEGRVLLVENYDLALARRLVAGVDVWLNNPVYPLEASGTSGMKAGLNGTLNLSVRDGWWDEGCDGTNGWAIKPVAESVEPHRRDTEEADALYRLLEDQVIPLYYARNSAGYSPGWVRMSKRSMATILPQFSAARQVNEYVANFYLPASRQWRRFSEADFANAKRLADWKAKVATHWPNVTLRRADDADVRRVSFGRGIRIEVAAQLAGLVPDDVVIEALIAHDTDIASQRHARALRFEPDGTRTDAGEHRFVLELVPELCGKLEYRIRLVPQHPLLTHPLEMGRMRWL